MKLLNKYITISVLSMLTISGCKQDESEQKSTEQVRKEISSHKTNIVAKLKLNEFNMMEHLRSFQEIANKNEGNRAVGTAGGKETAKYILNHAEKMQYKTTLTSFNTEAQISAQNIMVEIPGQSNEKVIIIGSHYDSMRTGAGINDNASGVSVLLELMSQIHQQKIIPKYTIQFGFWDAEEAGLEGSRYYAEKLDTNQLKKIKAYINLDMAGISHPIVRFTDVDKSSIHELENILRKDGYSEDAIKDEIERINQLPTFDTERILEKSLRAFFEAKKYPVIESIVMLERTDAGSFSGKVPVIGFGLVNDSKNLYPCYHKACDTVDIIDSRSLALSGNAVIHLLDSIKAL